MEAYQSIWHHILSHTIPFIIPVSDSDTSIIPCCSLYHIWYLILYVPWYILHGCSSGTSTLLHIQGSLLEKNPDHPGSPGKKSAFQHHSQVPMIVCDGSVLVWKQYLGIILGMGLANERRRYYVTPPLIGRAHTQNDPGVFHNSLWKKKLCITETIPHDCGIYIYIYIYILGTDSV